MASVCREIYSFKWIWEVFHIWSFFKVTVLLIKVCGSGTLHTLKIDDMATDVQIIEGITPRIGMFEMEWMTFSEVVEQTAAPEASEGPGPQHPPMQEPQEV